ncbi:MAG: cyanophycin synthetase [Chloroflexota bacterium]
MPRRCALVDAEMWMIGRDFDIVADGKYVITCQDEEFDDVQFGMSGRFQAKNGAAAIAAVRALNDVEISQEAIFAGLKKAKLPGRVELIQENPLVVLDGAHNADKMQATISILNELRTDRRIITVLAMKAGKAAPDILPTVTALSDHMIFTTFLPKGLWEAYKPGELAAIAAQTAPDLPIETVENPHDALKRALTLANDDDILWITGSLYLVGDLRSHWFPIENLLNSLEGGLNGE